MQRWLRSQPLILFQDRDFLAQIPVEVHAALAETAFRENIDRPTVQLMLKIYNKLPTYLTKKGLEYNAKYFRDQKFLDSLSCSVFLTLSSNTAFLDRLAPADLAALAKNAHLWDCLPVDVIRRVMKNGKLGAKLGLEDVANAAKAMSRAKSLDMTVVANLLQFQVPDMAKSALTLPTLFSKA
jgi:hypothetical protein